MGRIFNCPPSRAAFSPKSPFGHSPATRLLPIAFVCCSTSPWPCSRRIQTHFRSSASAQRSRYPSGPRERHLYKCYLGDRSVRRAIGPGLRRTRKFSTWSNNAHLLHLRRWLLPHAVLYRPATCSCHRGPEVAEQPRPRPTSANGRTPDDPPADRITSCSGRDSATHMPRR
jgi:hypothetical protein